MDQNWIKNLAIKAIHICRINKIAAKEDLSLPVLDDLLQQGYTNVVWNADRAECFRCRDLNKQQWELDDFLRSTTHAAPIASHGHPNDLCTVIVSGEGLPDVEVDYDGHTDENIAPVTRTPKAPKPTVKRLAPKPETKIIEQPVPPKQKTVYVPKDVHKQMKDPFEKQKLTPEEYADWLRDLEKENVEEERPTQPTDEDREEWLSDLERETSLKRPARWIMGIFER